MKKQRVMVSWSTGKDAAWMLHTLQQDPSVELVGIFCTVNKTFGRVAMHAVRLDLLQRQAAAIGLPLTLIEIPYPCSNEDYETAMRAFVEQAKADGIEAFAFGDLYLEDIRKYREERLKDCGIVPIFPNWLIPTPELARRIIDSGFRAILTCVDPKQISPDFAGRSYDASLLDDLPDHADPCGENGEFHTFVFDGPIFRHPIDVQTGPVLERDGFFFTDLTSTAGS